MSENCLLETIAEDVREVKVLLTGPPDAPEKGLIVRTDRLEQSHKVAARIFWIAVGGVLTPGFIGAGLYVFLITF